MRQSARTRAKASQARGGASAPRKGQAERSEASAAASAARAATRAAADAALHYEALLTTAGSDAATTKAAKTLADKTAAATAPRQQADAAPDAAAVQAQVLTQLAIITSQLSRAEARFQALEKGNPAVVARPAGGLPGSAESNEQLVRELKAQVLALQHPTLGSSTASTSKPLTASDVRPRGTERAPQRGEHLTRMLGAGGSLHDVDPATKDELLSAFREANLQVGAPHATPSAQHTSRSQPAPFGDLMLELRRDGFQETFDDNENVLAGLINKSAESSKSKAEAELKKMAASLSSFFAHGIKKGWYARAKIESDRDYFDVNHYILMSVLHLHTTRGWPVASQYFIRLMQDNNQGFINLLEMAQDPRGLGRRCSSQPRQHNPHRGHAAYPDYQDRRRQPEGVHSGCFSRRQNASRYQGQSQRQRHLLRTPQRLVPQEPEDPGPHHHLVQAKGQRH